MANDRFVIALRAETMYEEELAKRLGINPHSEYGRKKLNEYLEEERKSDELSAIWHLENSNPGKFFSYNEIRSEARRIRQKRLAPYVEKVKMEQKLEGQQELSDSDVKIATTSQEIKIDSQYIGYKDSYTYRQILIGLRNEFLKYQKKLDKLRELSVVFGKYDYYYNLYKVPYTKELPELVIDKCIKEYDPKTIGALIYHLFFYHKPTRTIMLRDNNGNYFPKRINGNSKDKKDEFAIFPRYEDNEEFIELANEILGSNFANMMQLDSKVSAITSAPIVYKKTPTIVPTLSSYGFTLCTGNSRFEYLGRNDIIRFSSVRMQNEKWQPLTQEHLDFVSRIEFPKDAFSEYHQALIEESIDDGRPIVLSEDYQPELLTKFEIQDSPKQLVLTKSQIKRKL